jgi:hypothetical protein
MMLVGDLVQQYADAYANLTGTLNQSDASSEVPDEALSAGFGVNEVLYGLMSENDRLNELTKLVGQLRFAVEGSEDSIVREAEVDISLLSGHFPDDHRIATLVDLIKGAGANGQELANLYLQRCFHVVHQEYVQLGKIEERIQLLESGSPADESD